MCGLQGLRSEQSSDAGGALAVQATGLGLHCNLLLHLPRLPRSILLDVGLRPPSPGEPQAPPPHQASEANIRAMKPCSSVSSLDLSHLPVNTAQVGSAVRHVSDLPTQLITTVGVNFCEPLPSTSYVEFRARRCQVLPMHVQRHLGCACRSSSFLRGCALLRPYACVAASMCQMMRSSSLASATQVSIYIGERCSVSAEKLQSSLAEKLLPEGWVTMRLKSHEVEPCSGFILVAGGRPKS
jgi:hypothetical protein